VQSSSSVAISDPLADRALRLYIKPFNAKSKFESFDQPLERSAEMQNSNAHRDEEERRLFYVAMTRARDYLYFCSYKAKLTIPELVNPALNQLDLPDGLQESTLTWKDNKLQLQLETMEMLEELPIASTEEVPRNYFAPPVGRIEHVTARLNPSSQDPIPTATISGTDVIHDRHYISRSQISDAELGTCIHNLFCAYDERLSAEATQIWVTDYLSTSKFQGLIDSSWLSKSLLAFHHFLTATYIDYTLYRELPIQAIDEQGRNIEGFVDLVVEVGDALFIIDYKTFCASTYDAAVYEKKAKEFSGQLALYEELLEQSFGKRVDGTFVYFVFEGRMVEIACN